MGKIKSAICLTLITLVIAVLCVVCFVPFPLANDGISYYNPIINWAEKGSEFGGFRFGGESPYYVGGSFSAVYYPEGVISEREYRDNLAGKTDSDRSEYVEQYVPYAGGALYLEKETVCDGGTEPTEEFKAAFETGVVSLRERFEQLHWENTEVAIQDGYTVRASLPAAKSAVAAAFVYFSYSGELTVCYGTSQDAASATQVLPETTKNAGPITDYLKGVSSSSLGGTPYVLIDFTDEGLSLVRSATANAAETNGYLFVKIGDEAVVSLTVTEQVHDSLYISGNYTGDTASIVSAAMSTAMKYGSEDFGLKIGDLRRNNAGLSDIWYVYAAIGICFVLTMVVFFIRYGRLAFAHLYSYLVYLIAMVLCYWAIPISIGLGTVVAFALMSVLLTVSNAISYEFARKEYAVGKTITSSVKTGYKRCFWSIFDLHIVLLILGLFTFFIALSEMSAFALALALGAAISGLCTLAVNRFMWYIMMPFAKNPGKFCHFKREEVEDDE